MEFIKGKRHNFLGNWKIKIGCLCFKKGEILNHIRHIEKYKKNINELIPLIWFKKGEKMKKILILILFAVVFINAQTPSAKSILEKVDENMVSENQVVISKMIIHGRRISRTIRSKSWSIGDSKNFTEYLSPAREKGTKMLKIEDNLWIYTPSTDRIIKISGHMLKQSIMGSDLSYEDMMESQELTESYDAKVTGSTVVDEANCWVIDLMGKVDDLAYHKRKIWVDTIKYIPLREELYAKNGKLLKRMELKNIINIEGRWYPKKMIFKDMLKRGKGTEFVIDDIKFDQDIPEYKFSKAGLKR